MKKLLMFVSVALLLVAAPSTASAQDDGGSGIPVIGPIADGLGSILGGVGHVLRKTGDGVGDVLAGVGDAVGGGASVTPEGGVQIGPPALGGEPPKPEVPVPGQVDKWEKALDRIGDQIDKILSAGVPPESLGALLEKLLEQQGDVIEAKADADGSGDGSGEGGGDGSGDSGGTGTSGS